MPIATIILTIPTAYAPAGTIYEVTAIIRAGGFEFYEVGEQLISNLEAKIIEEH